MNKNTLFVTLFSLFQFYSISGELYLGTGDLLVQTKYSPGRHGDLLGKNEFWTVEVEKTVLKLPTFEFTDTHRDHMRRRLSEFRVFHPISHVTPRWLSIPTFSPIRYKSTPVSLAKDQRGKDIENFLHQEGKHNHKDFEFMSNPERIELLQRMYKDMQQRKTIKASITDEESEHSRLLKNSKNFPDLDFKKSKFQRCFCLRNYYFKTSKVKLNLNLEVDDHFKSLTVNGSKLIEPRSSNIPVKSLQLSISNDQIDYGPTEQDVSSHEERINFVNNINCIDIEIKDTHQVFSGILIYLNAITDEGTMISNPAYDENGERFCPLS